jgi:hypothetical protein
VPYLLIWVYIGGEWGNTKVIWFIGTIAVYFQKTNETHKQSMWKKNE